MFWACFRFELLLRLKSPSTWVALLTIGALNAWQYMSAHWDKLVGAGSVARNSPFSVYNSFMVTSFWAAVLGCGYMTAPLLRDLRLRIAPVVYACPINDRIYFWAKYCAGLAALFIVMTSVVMATVLMPVYGPMITPPVPGEYIPTPWAHIGYAWMLFVVPGVFIVGTIHYVLAVNTAKVTPSYALAAGFLLLWAGLAIAFEGAKTVPLSMQLVDPLAKLPLELMTFKWSPQERMTEFVSLTTPVGANRLLYTLIAAGLLLATAARFDLRRFLSKDKPAAARKPQAASSVPPFRPEAAGTLRSAGVLRLNSRATQWLAEALSLGWRDFVLCFREAPFVLLVTLCALFSLTGALKVFALYQSAEGTLLPITFDVVQLAVEAFFIGGIMTMMFYVGEIFARERASRAFLVTDASAIPDWAQLVSKLTASAWLALFMSIIPAAVAFATQLMKGYVDGDWMNYYYRVCLLLLPSMLAFGALAAIMHSLTGHRALGHGLTIGLALAFCIGHEVDFLSHPLSKWGLSGFHTVYSQFAAFAQFQDKIVQTDVYWLLLAAALLIVGYWLWPRGIELGLHARMATLRRNLSVVSTAGFVLALTATAALGWSIHSTSVVRNHSLPHAAQVAQDAEYERRYGNLRDLNQPKILRAELRVDLDPQRRAAAYSGDFAVKNVGTQPIEELYLETEPFVTMETVALRGERLTATSVDAEYDHHVFRLSRPLQPQEEAQLSVNLRVAYAGYVAKGYHGTLVEDGSTFETKLWPRFGYEPRRELRQRGDRLRHGLGERVTPPPLSAAADVRRGYWTDDADLVRVTLRVSTPQSQIPVAPGELVEETVEQGRRIRTYRSDVDSIWDMPIASATYEVLTAANPLPIEVYYNPRHSANAQRFVEATQFALDKLTALFGPYPHASVRIAETPNGLVEPQSARGLTLLPELKGWTHDYRNEQSFDYVLFAVTKHLAHAWLAERTPPSWLRGAETLEEAVPDLIALDLVATRHGAAMAERYVADELELYLRESVREDSAEPALVDAYDQEYLSAKSLVALWATRSILGREATLSAIAELPRRAAGEAARPWTDLGQLMSAFDMRAQSDYERALLREMFESVRVYDFSARSAVTNRQGGRYRTRFEVDARGVGIDSAAAGVNRARLDFREPVEIVAVDADGAVLGTLIAQLSAGVSSLEMFTAQQPAAVVVDPAGKRLDQARLNNRAVVRAADKNLLSAE